MNSHAKSFGLVAFGIAVGGALMWFWSRSAPQTVWLSFDHQSYQPLQLERETIFPSDNEVGMTWSILSLTGRATLIDALDGTSALQLGYMVTVTFDSVTTENFPTVCQRPVRDISLRVVPHFELKDENGFVLASIDGVQHVAATGRQSTLQATSPVHVPGSFRSRAQHVDVSLKAWGLQCDG